MEWTADVIRARRLAKGMTQQQLADAAGVSRSVVNKWETGVRVASGPSIGGLERALGTQVARNLDIGEATEIELLTELINRRLAAVRESSPTSPDLGILPVDDLDWPDESAVDPGLHECEGNSGQS